MIFLIRIRIVWIFVKFHSGPIAKITHLCEKFWRRSETELRKLAVAVKSGEIFSL